ncbi:hypothetical protein J6590_037488 [Homalodisca vitripennis]|nr:hypothetical protein J6590_037488 [Homalodisca vitripennis]
MRTPHESGLMKGKGMSPFMTRRISGTQMDKLSYHLQNQKIFLGVQPKRSSANWSPQISKVSLKGSHSEELKLKVLLLPKSNGTESLEDFEVVIFPAILQKIERGALIVQLKQKDWSMLTKQSVTLCKPDLLQSVLSITYRTVGQKMLTFRDNGDYVSLHERGHREYRVPAFK